MSATVLCIGGMDSSGGAGILRDAATIAAMGGQVRAAVTAVTAQTDRGVAGVYPVAPDGVAAQIASAGPVDAVKIGMLGTADIVHTVANELPDAPRVLDPVLISTSGFPLLESGGIAALINELVPKVDLVTPNLPELFALARHIGCDTDDPAIAVQALLGGGFRSVLVKGGHGGGGQSVDVLYQSGRSPKPFATARVAATLRGTGCRLASAIALGLATGAAQGDAITAAKAHVHAAFLSAKG